MFFKKEIFNWLTGETDNTLAVGMVVAARAFRQTERSVLCRLERYSNLFNFYLLIFILILF
jgi:hypothetical protein